MQHLRYCLRCAIQAADTLDTDATLRSEWRDRLQHCAGDDGHPPPKLGELEQLCHDLNPPEFGEGRPYRPQPAKAEGSPAIGQTSWYFGQSPWSALQTLRSGSFVGERDLPAFRELIRRWKHPNGLVWGMSIANYGRAGAWSESLGVNAPLLDPQQA